VKSPATDMTVECGHHQRLQREDLADQLSRQGADVRLRRNGCRTNFPWSWRTGCRCSRHGLSLGQSGQPRPDYRDYGEYIAGVWCKAAKQSHASRRKARRPRLARSASAPWSGEVNRFRRCRPASRFSQSVALASAVAKTHEGQQGCVARPLPSALPGFQHRIS